MAEARAPEAARQNLFYCHECTSEIIPQLPDYICPRCHNGFIEPASAQSSSSSSSSDGGLRLGYDSDSDDHSTGSSFDMEDILEPTFAASLGNIIVGGGGDLLPYNMEVGAEGGEGSNSGNSATSSAGPSRRPFRNRAVINTLLMGPGNRRSRLRGPDRHAVLGPMLHDLIVHFTTGSDPLGLPMFSEEMAGNPGDYVWGRGGFDAVITHLMSQLENTGPPPLSETQIQHIPTVAITEEQIKDKSQCSICMEDFVLSENVKQLRCDHCFHETCIKPWLQMHATCPVCRKKLTDGTTQMPGTSGATQQPQQNQSRRLVLGTGGGGSTIVFTTSRRNRNDAAVPSDGGSQPSSSSPDPGMMDDDDLD